MLALTRLVTALSISVPSALFVNVPSARLARCPAPVSRPIGGAGDWSTFLGGPMEGGPLAVLAEEAGAEELELALLQEDLLIVDIYASWCGPCLLLAPEMDTVASELEGRCRVLKFDSEQQPGGPELATSLGVHGLPTLLFFEDGLLVHRVEGALQAERILALANGVFFNGPMPHGPEYGTRSE
jgi:thiol-disulfide isomerase/thioredoxin